MTEPKRLYRNTNDAMLAGVCSGIADFLGIDKTLVRVLWAILTLLTAFVGGIVAYILFWLIAPESPSAVEGSPSAVRTLPPP